MSASAESGYAFLKRSMKDRWLREEFAYRPSEELDRLREIEREEADEFIYPRLEREFAHRLGY